MTTVILNYSDTALWQSCQSITSNLNQAYKNAFPKAKFLSLPRQNQGSHMEFVADEIRLLKPDRLIFTDDPNPHPQAFFEYLFSSTPHYNPEIIIHVYGDFVFHADRWYALRKFLQGRPIAWVCASKRQELLLRRLVQKPATSTLTCPFPLSRASFHYSQTARLAGRKKLSVGSDQTVFFYSGRLTFQKNVLRLISEFGRFAESHPRAVLFLSGTFDHLGGPYDPRPPLLGRFYQDYVQACSTLNPKVASRIKYLGHQSSTDLKDLYNAADVFVSLSTFHDEDYGMAPAEALMTGCSTILTDWGGYSGFSNVLKFIPVHLGSGGLTMESNAIQNALTDALNRPAGPREREARALAFQDQFSISSIEPILSSLHEIKAPGFRGFSETMGELSRRLERLRNRWIPVFDDGKGPGSFYERVYDCYWKRIRINQSPRENRIQPKKRQRARSQSQNENVAVDF